MLLKEYFLKTYCENCESISELSEARAKCAGDLGVSVAHLGNMISKGFSVIELKDGRWMTLTKYNKTFK